MKKLFTFLTFALFAMVSLRLSALTLSAEEPKTYYVKYNENQKDWWYQEGSSWDAEKDGNLMYFFFTGVKDGDHVIVDGTAGEQELHIDANLSSLTIIPNSKSSVYATSIQDCYILGGGYANIHSNVTNGYLYDFSVCNFHMDARNVTVSYSVLDSVAVAVVGKCDALLVQDINTGFRKYHLYDFKSAAVLRKGVIEVDPSQYSLVPPAAAPATPEAGDEYDEVPKTGESANYLFAFAAAMLCFAGAYAFKRRY